MMLNSDSNYPNKQWEVGVTMFMLALLIAGTMVVAWLPEQSLDAYLPIHSSPALTTGSIPLYTETETEPAAKPYVLLLPRKGAGGATENLPPADNQLTLAEVVQALDACQHGAESRTKPCP